MNRSMTVLNERGDQTIVWDESSDEQMLSIIEKKLEEGVAFFIVEPRFFGLLPPKKTRLVTTEEARKHRALSIPDEDLAKFVGTGNGSLEPTPENISTGKTKRSKNAKEIVGSQSIAVKPKKGG